MKTKYLYIAFTIGTFGAVFSSCETTNKNEETPTVEQTHVAKVEGSVTTASVNAVAVINSDTILSNYDFATKLRDELTAQSLKYERILRQQESTLMTEMQTFQAEAATLSQFQGQIRQRELIEKKDKLQLRSEEYTRKIMLLEQQYNRDIDASINEFLGRYCAGKSFKIVLSETELGVIRWVDQSLDITNEVLVGLNEEYQAQQVNQTETAQ